MYYMSDIHRIISKTYDKMYLKLMIKLMKINVWKCVEAFLSIYALHILDLS